MQKPHPTTPWRAFGYFNTLRSVSSSHGDLFGDGLREGAFQGVD